MATPFTPDDLVLLGYEEIKPIPVGGSAIAYSAKAKAGIEQAEHAFVYVKTDITIEDAIKVASVLQKRSPLYILKSRSGPADSIIKIAFGRAASIYQIEDLLWARVKDLFKAYANNISQNIPAEPNFIAPRGEDLLPKDRLDTYLIEYFTRDVRNPAKKRLVVLKANAGVGKTTLCRQLVKQFAKKIDTFNVTPVYVEAAHWGGRVSSGSGLWDIIQLSLQNFDASSGISRTLFEAALKRGLILFVFDGFDELCSSPRSNISVTETIDSLREWAEDSEARIILTTRTPYWDAEVRDDPEEVYSLNLLPFNPQQAKDYIRKFFEVDDQGFHTARDLYADVIAHATLPDNAGGARAQFWSLPIAVSMVCDAVKAGVSRDTWKTYSLDSLLVAICERETKRQNLGITGKKQLDVFQEVALLEARKEQTVFHEDDLLAAGVPESDLAKFASHPLVRRAENGGYLFAYDFFAPYLRAVAIRDSVRDRLADIRTSVLDAMRAEENGKGYQIEHVVRLLDRDSDIDDLYNFIGRIPHPDVSARSFLVHVLMQTCDSRHDTVSSRERAEVLLRALTESATSTAVRDARFTGVFEKLDLSGTEFINCEFVDVSFRNVAFVRSNFRSCKFSGDVQFLTRHDEDSFAQASLEDCEIRGTARLALESLLLRDSKQQVELVKDLLESGLSKFWHNGKFKQTLRKADWKKGALGRARSSDDLLDVFKKSGLISDATASGVREGVWVFNRDAITDLQNFMDHRRISGFVLSAFNEIKSILKLA